MNYQRTLLVQRQEELQQRLMTAESMKEKVAIDAELTHIELALKGERTSFVHKDKEGR